MLTRWEDFDRTFAVLDDFRRRMDQVFEDFGRGYWPMESQVGPARSWPAISLYDEGNRLTVYAEVPGLSDKDIQVTLNQDVLTLSGERKIKAPEGYSVHRRERHDVNFSRSFSLPCKVNPEKVSARVSDGLLQIGMEKAAEAQPRQITVKAS